MRQAYRPQQQGVLTQVQANILYKLGDDDDVRLHKSFSVGARILVFNSDQQQYEVPWNEGENNSFGMNALLMQIQLNYMF